MATNSICKNITVKKKYEGRHLVLALENASRKHCDPVILSKKCRELKGEQLKEIFGKL